MHNSPLKVEVTQMNDEVQSCFLQNLDGRPLRPFKNTPPAQHPAETAREDELILMKSN